MALPRSTSPTAIGAGGGGGGAGSGVGSFLLQAVRGSTSTAAPARVRRMVRMVCLLGLRNREDLTGMDEIGIAAHDRAVGVVDDAPFVGIPVIAFGDLRETLAQNHRV